MKEFRKRIYARGIVALAKMIGGKDEFLKQLEISRLKGNITSQQKYRLKKAFNELYETGTDILTSSEKITESDIIVDLLDD